MSSERQISQVTNPTTTGRTSRPDAPRCDDDAHAPRPASGTKTNSGAHQARAASWPAQANSTAVSARMTATSTGLSWWPSTEIAFSVTGPGVRRMTSSATATTGESRMVIAMATK